MRTLTLYRMRANDVCTLGRLEAHDSVQICVTLEEPWRDANQDGIGDKNVSRIPAGEYVCRRDMHGKSKPNPYEVWEVLGVPGRSEIHIHIGNTSEDTLGCILVGSAWAGANSISGSRNAFDKLMRETKDLNELTLRVVDIP